MTRPKTTADRQNDRWERWVREMRSGPAVDFGEHWATFRRIYARRRPEDPPPQVWRPHRKQIQESNLGRLMTELGFRDYRKFHRWSVENRDEFWSRVIDRLRILFARKPETALVPGGDVEDPRWLAGARLSCVDSCFKPDSGRRAVIVGGEGASRLNATTYGELEALVNRVANGLREKGFKPGDGIALYMPMTVDCVAAYLGVIRAGGRVVSIADSFSSAELARRCRLGEAETVVTTERYARAGRTIELYAKVKEAAVPRAIVIRSADGEAAGGTDLRSGDLRWSDLLSERTTFDSMADEPEAVTNVLFSSGTTAEPKAIPWTHLTSLKCAMDGHLHHDIRPGDVVAWPTNIGWMMGPWLIYATLINEATIALYEGAPIGAGFARFVKESGVTMLGVIPSLVRAWRSSDAVSDREWEGIRVFSSTGEPSNREDYLWLMSRAGYLAPIIEYLGGTEIGGGHITGTVVQPASPATFTTAALGTDFVILGEDGGPVPEGGAGELYLIPPAIGMSQRLLNKDHHEAYYEGCPRGPGGEVLRRHGDQIARLPGGFFKAQGRSDDTMNLGGIKVSSLELEHVVNEHPEVYESAAVAVQPEGEGAERLVLFVVTKGGIGGDRLLTELKRKIAQELNPLFKIHDLVVVEELPRTASNKLMRRTLRARYGSGS
jgi:acetyl-CoA synthetase